MGVDHFSFAPFNFHGFQGGYGSIQEEAVFQRKPSLSDMELELLEEINPLPVDHGKEANSFKDQNQQQQQEGLKFDNLMFEEFILDPAPQPTPQPFQKTAETENEEVASSEHVESNNKQVPGPVPVPPSSIGSLELLRNYVSRFKKLGLQTISNSSNIETSVDRQKLSTEDILRVAGARYIQYSAHWNDNFFIPVNPYGFDVEGLSEEENRDVELAQFLLAAAERIGYQQFERASRLLLHCQWNSSASANSVQRVIYHFSQALRERIDKETGTVTVNGSETNIEIDLVDKLDTSLAIICHQKIPFCQVLQFTAIQTIVEHVASETKIHVIDLGMRRGVYCICLMRALMERQERPVELFKVTAIGVAGQAIPEETGKRLASFAESLNFPFSYNVVYVRDMKEIKEDQFEIEDDEAVVVYAPFMLRTMVSRPDCLENLMRVIRNIKPSIMVVLEVEGSHNSPSFVNRFIESLFYYSAYFDCIETCMSEENECRVTMETILSEGIRNIVATEGKERTVRNVKIDVWRRFFARYRMVETGFSESSLYQADLVANEFAHGKFCTVDRYGMCVLVGWKGSPMHSISAWKFL